MSSTPALELSDFPRTLAEARAGAGEALGRLWMECRNYLLFVANQHLDADLRAKVSASDLVQETFLEAQRAFAQFHGVREEELRAWLVRILANNIANATRSYRATEMRAVDREVPLAGPGEAGRGARDLAQDTPTPSDRAIAREDLEALERARARLPEHYRQALCLRYERQLSFAAIGAEMGCSAEAARKLWARAVDLLEKELNPHDEP
jgi:RNA polymerase sigma-70 factor (ECF subfamily)